MTIWKKEGELILNKINDLIVKKYFFNTLEYQKQFYYPR